ncbi:hypothetical protein BDEG_20706 [Batrachochytrium dendrobatidis JEL423]|nr:hypothetical protein BDEG_20706 [Batrachochytrium dendrobatidis JEL423]
MASASATSRFNLLDTLQLADLEPYYSNLTAFGIKSVDQLMTLTMQDYGVLGVQSMEDRKKLFQLIQTLKSESPMLVDNGSSFHRTLPAVSRLESRIPGPSMLPKPAAFAAPPAYHVQPSHSTHSQNQSHSHHHPKHTSPHSLSQRVSQQYVEPVQPPIPVPTHQPQYEPPMRSLISNAARLHHAHTAPALGNSMEDIRLSTADSYRERKPSHSAPDSEDTDEEMAISGNSGSFNNHAGRNPIKKKQHVLQGQLSFSPKRSPLQLNAYGVPISVAALDSTTISGTSNATLHASSSSLKSNAKTDLSDRIRVCVRKRPLNKKELKKGESDIATVNGRRTIAIFEPKVKVDLTKYVETHEFTFDEAFDSETMNDEVYRRTAFPLVEYIFQGGKATCFAYGQTGSGKTHTMLNETDGLYVMAGSDIFSLLGRSEYSHLAAWVSFYEIYQGQLYDLLGARKKLFAREDGKQNVCIKGIKEYEVSQVGRLMEIFEHGNATRSTGVTGANADSSRSHAILQIVLKHKEGKGRIQGKLSFIDLAGSERGADRGETDQKTRMEGSEINKSLLALKECIRALDQDSRHTPFRQSKLTQVLKDSFIGNSKTCMIATISPNISNSEHSLNTLRYAYRVKELKNDGTVDPRDYATDGQDTTAFVDDEGDADIEADDVGDEDGDEPLLLDEEFPPENMAMGEEATPIQATFDGFEEGSHEQSQQHRRRSPSKTQQKSAILSQLNKNGSPVKRSHGNSSNMPNADLNSSMVSAFQRSQLMERDGDRPIDLKGMATSLEAPQLRGSQSNHPLERNVNDGRLTLSTSASGAVGSSESLHKVSTVANMSDVEELIRMHRQHIRDNTESGKIESKLLVNLTMKPGAKHTNEHGINDVSFDSYVAELDSILAKKMNRIAEMRAKMQPFLQQQHP